VKIIAIVVSGRYGNKSMGQKLMEMKFYKKMEKILLVKEFVEDDE
jgi:hypothetical protein